MMSHQSYASMNRVTAEPEKGLPPPTYTYSHRAGGHPDAALEEGATRGSSRRIPPRLAPTLNALTAHSNNAHPANTAALDWVSAENLSPNSSVPLGFQLPSKEAAAISGVTTPSSGPLETEKGTTESLYRPSVPNSLRVSAPTAPGYGERNRPLGFVPPPERSGVGKRSPGFLRTEPQAGAENDLRPAASQMTPGVPSGNRGGMTVGPPNFLPPYGVTSGSVGTSSSSVYDPGAIPGGYVGGAPAPTGVTPPPVRLHGGLGTPPGGHRELHSQGDPVEDEPPLLEGTRGSTKSLEPDVSSLSITWCPSASELGINPGRIWERMKSVLLFYRLDHDLLMDVDMCGPLFIAACLGCCLLLAGKVHFGYIYGLSVTSCVGVCLLLNLMSQKEGIDLYSTVSILGYGLMPVVGLASISIVVSLRTFVGAILSVLSVLWCTATASRFFETALEMTHQRYLVAYPIALIYGCFVLITVF